MTERDNRDTDIPVSYIQESFSMDALGRLYWKKRPASHFATKIGQHSHRGLAGKPAGNREKNANGYLMGFITYNGTLYSLQAHRVVWVLHTGCWPKQQIDHINRVRHDNRPENLRDVSADENMRNNGKNGTGLIGAYRILRSNRFYSHIRDGKKIRYLGSYDTAEQANAAYLSALRARLQGATE